MFTRICVVIITPQQIHCIFCGIYHVSLYWKASAKLTKPSVWIPCSTIAWHAPYKIHIHLSAAHCWKLVNSVSMVCSLWVLWTMTQPTLSICWTLFWCVPGCPLYDKIRHNFYILMQGVSSQQNFTFRNHPSVTLLMLYLQFDITFSFWHLYLPESRFRPYRFLSRFGDFGWTEYPTRWSLLLRLSKGICFCRLDYKLLVTTMSHLHFKGTIP